MFCPSRSVVLFEPLSQGVGGHPDDGVHLRVKIRRTSQDLHGDAVFFDLVDRAFEVLCANEIQKSNKIVGPAEHPGRQNCVQFRPLGQEPVYR